MLPTSGDKRRASSPIRGTVSSAAITSPPRRFSSPQEAHAVYSDRYIPSRTGSSLDNGFDMLVAGESEAKHNHSNSAKENSSTRIMNSLIRAELLGERSFNMNSAHPSKTSRRGNSAESPNVLRYKSSETEDTTYSRLTHSSPGASFRRLSSPSRLSLHDPKKTHRKISRIPYKVLDAPSLQDDFYLNLIDWSTNNVLAVGLGSSVFLWSAYTSKVTKLNDFSDSCDDTVTSVVWISASHLIVGLNSGNIEVWDTSHTKRIRKMEGHSARVGALAWSAQSSILASGSRDRKILLQDVRVRGNFSPLISPSVSPYYSPYSSTRRFSSPVALHNSREAEMTRVFSTRPKSVLPMSGYAAAALSDADRLSDKPDEREDKCRDSPTPDERVDCRIIEEEDKEESVHEASWSIFDPDDTIDHFLSVPLHSDQSAGGKVPLFRDSNIDLTTRECTNYGGKILEDTNEKVFAAPPLPFHSTPKRHLSYPMMCSTPPRTSPCQIKELLAHKQEVCGLKWSFDDKHLASGGNDNKLCVWNINGTTEENSRNSSTCSEISPEFIFDDHTAAVKAIAWSPHQSGLLASGGGTADRTIRFWNTTTGTPLHHVETGSQVCNLLWSTQVNEIVSTHGYSLNQIAIWRYPSMQKITTLTGHTYRVLYLAMSPDGQSIVTGAGDETLRFWNVFPGRKLSYGSGANSTVLFPSGGDIR